MEDIAQESGMSKGALYWYFNSKDELISNILGYFFDREFALIQSWDLENESARTLLLKYCDLLFNDLESMKPFFSIAYEFMAMVSRNDSVKKIIQKSLHRYIEITVPIIQRGIDNGEFREIDAYETSLAFGALVEGSILLWVYDMEKFNFSELMSRNVEIFLDGLKKNA
jgi:AcrR family transcriptional regulator